MSKKQKAAKNSPKSESPDNFNSKLANYLTREYEFCTSQQTDSFANNLYKTKHDITKKMHDNLESFVILSDMFKASFVPGSKTSATLGKYGISPSVYDKSILDLIDFHIAENQKTQHTDKTIQDEFIANQRAIVKKIFEREMVQLVLDGIFQYNFADTNQNSAQPQKKQSSDVNYYSDISKILVRTGIRELVKHLHPEQEKNLISQLQFFGEIIGRLNIQDTRIFDK